MLSYTGEDDTFVYSPRFSTINLKYDDQSRLLSKVAQDGKLSKEDVIDTKDIEAYISSVHTVPISSDTSPQDFFTCVDSFSAFVLD